MGCTPSRRHRRIGLRHEPTVMPMGLYPGVDTWTRAPFVVDMTHAPVMNEEEPPPYSEVATNGHISLMYGYSPYKQTENIVHQTLVNSSILTDNNVSVMDSSYQGNESGHEAVHHSDYQTEREYVEDVLRSASPMHDQSCSSSCETSQLSWSFSGYQDHHYPTEQRRSSTPHVRYTDSTFPQRSVRSRSVDTTALSGMEHVMNENYSQVSDTEERPVLTPSPILYEGSHNPQTDVLTLQHPTLIDESGPFPVRPVRLPPLHQQLSYQEQSNSMNNGHKHRKRKRKGRRRRRGHSWHGEVVSELASQPQSLDISTNNNMSTVVE